MAPQLGFAMAGGVLLANAAVMLVLRHMRSLGGFPNRNGPSDLALSPKSQGNGSCETFYYFSLL